MCPSFKDFIKGDAAVIIIVVMVYSDWHVCYATIAV